MKCNYIRYIGGALLAGLLLLSSCTKDPLEEGDTIPGEATEGEGYLAIRIDAGDVVATRSEGPLDGTDAENQVNSVRVILYDASSGAGDDPKVKYAFHFNISTKPDGTPTLHDYYQGQGVYVNGGYRDESAVFIDSKTEKYKFVTFAQKVEYQDYKMLVIINPTASLAESAVMSLPFKPEFLQTRNNENEIWNKENPDYDKDKWESEKQYHVHNLYYLTRQGQPLSMMEKSFKLESQSDIGKSGSLAFCGDSENLLETPPNFVMTNSQGLIDVKAKDLGVDRAEAHEHPIPVTVDRIVAKVIVRKAEKFSVPDGARVENISYAFNYSNNHSYWWRNMNYLKPLSFDPYGSDELVLEVAGATDRSRHYAKVPNYEELLRPEDYDAGTDPESWLVEHNYDFLGEEHSLETSGEEGTINYILENTVKPENQNGSGYFTRVVVSANYIPEGLSEYDSYYTFKNKVITQAQMEEYIQEVEGLAKSTYVNQSGQVLQPFPRINAQDPPGMSGLLYAVFMLQYVGMYDGDEDAGSYLNGNFSPFDSDSGYGIAFYHWGKCYYTIPIRHFDYSGYEYVDPIKAYGYYGVVRNNIYTITVRSITGPGSPLPGGTAYISAGVNIVPWERIGNEVEIGEFKPVSNYITYRYYKGNDLFAEDFKYNIPLGQPIPFDSDIADRYYTEVNTPNVLYAHGQARILPDAVSADPADNIVEIVYPLIVADPVVEFHYVQLSDPTDEIRASVTRTYPPMNLTQDLINASGLLYNQLSHKDKIYLFTNHTEVYLSTAPTNLLTVPFLMSSGGRYVVNLYYEQPSLTVEYYLNGVQHSSRYFDGQNPGTIINRNSFDVNGTPTALADHLPEATFSHCDPVAVTIKGSLPLYPIFGSYMDALRKQNVIKAYYTTTP